MLASYACAISSCGAFRGVNKLDLTSSAHAQVLAADDMLEVNVVKVCARAARAHLAGKRDEHGLQSPQRVGQHCVLVAFHGLISSEEPPDSLPCGICVQ
jgi:hypothetical protein